MSFGGASRGGVKKGEGCVKRRDVSEEGEWQLIGIKVEENKDWAR